VPLAELTTLAAESWIPVLFGGMIPIAGALAVLYIIVRAVRDNDEEADSDK